MTGETNIKIICHIYSAIRYYQKQIENCQRMSDDYVADDGETKQDIIKYWQTNIDSAKVIINELEDERSTHHAL